MGRKRNGNSRGYSSRTIDIDILFYNNDVIRDERLNIPHPRISERMFTLVPLCELNGSFIHPVLQKTLHDLMAECTDRNTVVPFTP
jgi:2-amino-4-hydroxy-6-hydroxymethyldihydropteridine diphosphokinase